MSQNGVKGGHAQIMTLQIWVPKGTVLAVQDPSAGSMSRGDPHGGWLPSPWLIPGGRQHTTVHTPRTCFLCSCPCSRKSLKQTYTQVGPRHHALLLTIRNSRHHLLTGLSQTQGAGVTLCQEPSRWSRATCFSEARRRQELDLR